MSPTSQVRPPSAGDRPGAEVVAGLVDDDSAAAVAETAVRLARTLGGRVRFVQVLPPSLVGEARATAEAAMFTIALRALRGRPQLQATFEVPTGDPAALLVSRSRGALRLVLGQDDHDAGGRDPITAYCIAHAGCFVQVVPTEHS